MGEFVVKKWRCDRCGSVLDERPKLPTPRVSMRMCLEEEWHHTNTKWEELCPACNRHLLEIHRMLTEEVSHG